MARPRAGLPAGVRLSDHVSLGVIARTFPAEEVRRVLAETGKASERERDLPAHVMVYYAIALALYAGSGTREVLRCLLEGLRWLWGAEAVRVAGKSGISQARSRLGEAPLRRLYERLVRPIATPATKGARYRGWPSPVHSAHVGQEVVVHYPWHPLYRQRVLRQYSERRAAGEVVHIEAGFGVVTVVPAWMLDPVACAGMELGPPRVSAAALAELHDLLTRRGQRRSSPGDPTITREERDVRTQAADPSAAAPAEHAARPREVAGDEPRGAPGRGGDAGDPPDGSRGIGHEGARR